MAEEIMKFLESLGLPVRIADIPEATFLPGIRMEAGGVVVDPERLRNPGDLLHEVGHLALTDPERRTAVLGDAGDDGGEELGAIAWSYAAAIHLGIDPRVAFHADGDRGGAEAILENFAAGKLLGLPMLQWRGLALDSRSAREQGVPAYPHMVRWLRD